MKRGIEIAWCHIFCLGISLMAIFVGLKENESVTKLNELRAINNDQ
jgi:hypothetical protein